MEAREESSTRRMELSTALIAAEPNEQNEVIEVSPGLGKIEAACNLTSSFHRGGTIKARLNLKIYSGQ